MPATKTKPPRLPILQEDKLNPEQRALLNSLREAISAIGNRSRSQQSCAFHAARAQILARVQPKKR